MVNPENVARRIKSIYDDDYQASLDTVAAEWDAIQEVELTDFVDVVITALERPPAAWVSPLCHIGIGEMSEAGDTPEWQQYHNKWDLQIRIFYFFRHSDAKILALLIMRHMQATLDLLNRHPTLDFGQDMGVVRGTPVISPSLTSPQGNVLVKGLLTQFSFRVHNYGF